MVIVVVLGVTITTFPSVEVRDTVANSALSTTVSSVMKN